MIGTLATFTSLLDSIKNECLLFVDIFLNHSFGFGLFDFATLQQTLYDCFSLQVKPSDL
jgi:hypothetical protein